MKIIITGSTGLVGKAILLEALEDNRIKEILLINRTSLSIKNKKVKELILPDFSQIETIKDKLKNYDVLYHCMGVSALWLSEGKYTHITYALTKNLIDILFENNPDMTVCYVSGVGTDETEKSKAMRARVKGKTENYIFKKGFKKAYMIRLGAIFPEKWIKSRTKRYNIVYFILHPFMPLMKKSKNILTTTSFGKAMLNIEKYTNKNKYIDNKTMNILAKK